MTSRRPYTKDYSNILAELENRRMAGGLTYEAVAQRADIPLRTYLSIRQRQRAFPHQIKRLSDAIRALRREAAEMHMLEIFDDA